MQGIFQFMSKYFTNNSPRTRVSLQPLDSDLTAAKTELGSLTLDVTSKQKELQERTQDLQST